MGVNVVGGVTGSLVEVDSASLAARATQRPNDPGTLGHYSIAVDNGTSVIAAGTSVAAPIFSWRWGNANLAVVYSIKFGMTVTTTAFTAGRVAIDAIPALGGSFSASDTGGTAVTISGNNTKKRQSFGPTLLTDSRISATAVLVAGTRTLNATPMGKILAQASTAINYQIIQPNTTLFTGRDNSDQYPMTFAQNEGFIIQSTVPATGTWFFQVAVDWMEISAY